MDDPGNAATFLRKSGLRFNAGASAIAVHLFGISANPPMRRLTKARRCRKV